MYSTTCETGNEVKGPNKKVLPVFCYVGRQLIYLALMAFDTHVTTINNNDKPDSVAHMDRHKRKKSIVWEYFTVESVEAGITRAYCKQCKKSFAYISGSKLSGTSHLKRHITLGICQVLRQKNQQSSCAKTDGSPHDSANRPKKRTRTAPGLASNGIVFDQERCKHDIAKMIILHDYPLHIVGQQGFIHFVRTLQPQFNPLCLNSVEADCVAIYRRKKQNLLNFIKGIPARVHLSLDLWTSNQAMRYIFVRGHFIDGDWNLYHPILKVISVPFSDPDDSLNQTVATCLADWHLEDRLLTIGFDKSFSNETVIGNLRGLLSFKSPLILNGQLLNRNCYARVLCRLAVDALCSMRETIGKVRDSVKFVKSSESHKKKFFELKQQLQLPSVGDLLTDDQSKWNTTYHMLVAACELKEVFACYDAFVPGYKTRITLHDWKRLATLCTYLKYLYDAASILTAQPYPTANIFFPEVSKLQVELTRAVFSDDPFLSNLIIPLHEKFDQYWRESCIILAIAVALDPRHKMKLVEFTFAKIFGETAEPWIRIVEDGLRELFVEYNTQMLPFTTTDGEEIMLKTEPCQEGSFDNSIFEDGLLDYEICLADFIGTQQLKSELDEYLEEHLLPIEQQFDILSWWKSNGFRYPTLSRIASDFLSTPVSTLSGDSVFDTEIRQMDSYRSSLGSLTLEALICAKDWFQYESLPTDVSNTAVKLEF
ncbi:hypothetical protein RIF29_28620 [Crotalaria pallida]|uniref:BED-type domain-containing protein n=1 Tax=Crotalaria pallida TaxID=3830 RepID=A0AAN9EF54_CROPI